MRMTMIRFGLSRRERQARRNGVFMKKLTEKELLEQAKKIAAMPDDQIDFSDIPELTEADFRRGIRGLFYRPLKKPITIRLDADIIAWLKQDGAAYQTKANGLLRREMIRSLSAKKK